MAKHIVLLALQPCLLGLMAPRCSSISVSISTLKIVSSFLAIPPPGTVPSFLDHDMGRRWPPPTPWPPALHTTLRRPPVPAALLPGGRDFNVNKIYF